MRIYGYIRVESSDVNNSNINFDFFSKYGYEIPSNRIILEEVAVDTPILYRDKIINLINYGLEEGDLLIVKGIDSLGSNFEEILYLVGIIDRKNIKFICLDYAKVEISGDLKALFHHFLKICLDYEMKLKQPRKHMANNLTKRVGRPELLNASQKEEVINKFKKGYSVYALAKEYSVTRTVIQRILDKEKWSK
ncbi:recombinase family protein [Acinetobacter sp. ACIN00229]|uniref:recombinase family protein n=1 Tax=Acinetobacter sp. ACIN00229 TaxID=2792607 RepID=UPI0018DF19F2|nr:recombinase family protein [Acinetobacter sp. ACIN00229]MBI0423914.1 recombinase family protein [Acinetobacter sp. ACIN00229]